METRRVAVDDTVLEKETRVSSERMIEDEKNDDGVEKFRPVRRKKVGRFNLKQMSDHHSTSLPLFLSFPLPLPLVPIKKTSTTVY